MYWLFHIKLLYLFFCHMVSHVFGARAGLILCDNGMDGYAAALDGDFIRVVRWLAA